MCCLIQGLGRHILRYTTNINTSEKCHSYADGNGTFQKCMPKEPAPRAHPKSAVEARRHQDRQPNLLIHLKSDTPMQAGASFFKRMPKGPAQRAHPKVRGRSLEAQRPTTNILNKCQKCNSLADGNATCRTYMSKEPAPRAHPKSEVEAGGPKIDNRIYYYM